MKLTFFSLDLTPHYNQDVPAWWSVKTADLFVSVQEHPLGFAAKAEFREDHGQELTLSVTGPCPDDCLDKLEAAVMRALVSFLDAVAGERLLG